jgi:pyruvate dehydrogenase (quinone)
MKDLASDLLVDRLVDWGIDTVFGLPGDGIDGVLRAFRRRAGDIRLVVVHHEEAAALMAAGYAKATGNVGVCLATSGPGAIRLLDGLYDAKLERQPVLAVTELQENLLLGVPHPQELHLDKVFADVADYNVRVDVPVQIPAVVDIAIGHSTARGTVSHITFPYDLPDAHDQSPWVVMAPSATPATAPLFLANPGVPPRDELEHAAAVLAAGSRVAVLAGLGARGAREELLKLADTLAAPIVKSLPGKAAVPDDHPLSGGCVGLFGTRPAQQVLQQADTLLVVGTNFPYARHLPASRKLRAVHVDAELTRDGTPARAQVALVGDMQETLQALLPLLDRAEDRSFLEAAQEGMRRWRAELAASEDGGRTPVQPQFLARTVDRLAADDAILTTDSGTVATWPARHFDVRGSRQVLLSASLSSMAAGLPYAIAAQWAYPQRQCIAYVCSDGFAKLMGELITAVHHHLAVKVVVNNASATAPADFALWAEACGALGLRVEKPHELEPAIARALAHPGPALVDVLVNPEEVPTPV